jgi:hypothetical protein
MPFCPSCGSNNADTSRNCTNCGVALQGGVTVGAPIGFAPAQPSVVASMWASLDIGAKIAGVGGLVAFIAFWLPLYSGGENGVNMADGDIGWWVRLLLSLVAVGLLYFDYNNDLRTRIIVGAAQVCIGSIWGFELFSIMKGSQYLSGMAFGGYMMLFGFLAVAAGGFVSILNHSRRLAGVR